MPELGARPANSPSQSGTDDLGAQRFDAAHIAGQVAVLQRIARYEFAAGLVAGRAVLDAGCGFGDGTEVLAAAAAPVSAVDARAVMVEAAKSRLGDAVALAVAQPDALGFADDTFDVVVSLGPDDMAGPGEDALVELMRVLRPGGVLVTAAPAAAADQLAQRLRSRFGHARGFAQHDCLASLVTDGSDATTTNTRVGVHDRAPVATVFVASDSPPPANEPPATALLGPAAAVDAWIETAAAQDAALLELQGRLTALAPQNTREAHERLIELEQRLAEAERERFAAEQRHRWAQEAVDGMAGSLSWRITAPLRRLRRDRG